MTIACTTKHFDILSPKWDSPVTSNKILKVKKYKQCNDAALLKAALEWYKKSSSTSFCAFCRANHKKSQRALLKGTLTTVLCLQ
jgi:hypothetical protein